MTEAGTISTSRFGLTPANPVTVKRQCWREKNEPAFHPSGCKPPAGAPLGPPSPARLDYKDYIGFTQLKTELGGSTPTGAGVVVTQVEAGRDSTRLSRVFCQARMMLNSLAKLLLLRTSAPTMVTSGHATNVGQYFYGNTNSIAPGINSIYGYDADHWLGSAFLNTGYAAQPLATSARVANHSWIGAYVNADKPLINLPMSTPSNASIG